MKSTTLFIAAACPSTDVHAASVMRSIKKASPDTEFRFIGIGGPEMGHEGLEGLGVESKQFIFKPFFPNRNFYRKTTELAGHPVHMYTRFVNRRVLNKIEPQFFDIIQHYHPSAFLTFENEFFMMGLYKRLRKAYQDYNRICPPTFYYGLTQKDQAQTFQTYLDHMFTRVDMKQSNYERFIFPHTQVGWEGVYNGFRFLLSRSDKYKDLVQEQSILLPQGEQFRFDDFLSELVNQQRVAYRKSHSLGDQDLLLYFGCGNSEKEIKYSVKQVKEGIEKLLSLPEMKHFPRESIQILISVPEFIEHRDLAKKTISNYKWPIKVSVLETEEAKFQAMAASDIGLAVNGQLVAECATFQLPTLVLDAKPTQLQYFNQLYNGFDSDLNIALKGTVYPELLMQTIPNKIAYSILEHYQDPKLRYYYAKRHATILANSLPLLKQSAPSELVAKYNSVSLVSFGAPYTVIADTVLKAAATFDHIHANSHLSVIQNKELRNKAFQELGWAKGL